MSKLSNFKPKPSAAHLYHVAINKAVHNPDQLEYIHNWRIATFNRNDFMNFKESAYFLGFVKKHEEVDIFENQENENKLKLLWNPEVDKLEEDVDEEREELIKQYEELFGKKPTGNTKTETIKKKIEDHLSN